MLPIYIPTNPVMSLSHKITHYYLYVFELDNAYFHYSRKWSLIQCVVCCLKLILYRYWNHQHIHVCKECSKIQNTHFLYWKLLQMWYFDYVKSKYAPELPGFLYSTAFCACLNSSVSGYGYENPSCVQISGHINIEICKMLDKRCNLLMLYVSESNPSDTVICGKPLRKKKYWTPLIPLYYIYIRP